MFINNLYSTRNSCKILILITIVLQVKAGNKAKFCYFTTILDATWTDTRPEFAVNMTFYKQDSIRSLTWVNRRIARPVVRVNVLQNQNIVYNVSSRLCELEKFTKRISMFQQVLQSALKQGNYSMKCPMIEGLYVIDKLRIGIRNPLLGFLYRPKNSYTVIGGLYEEFENRSVVALTTYNLTIKIMKKSCAETN